MAASVNTRTASTRSWANMAAEGPCCRWVWQRPRVASIRRLCSTPNIRSRISASGTRCSVERCFNSPSPIPTLAMAGRRTAHFRSMHRATSSASQLYPSRRRTRSCSPDSVSWLSSRAGVTRALSTDRKSNRLLLSCRGRSYRGRAGAGLAPIGCGGICLLRLTGKVTSW